jgi:decaprenylphospho-beta-D-ribofuranose 2-oxidase
MSAASPGGSLPARPPRATADDPASVQPGAARAYVGGAPHPPRLEDIPRRAFTILQSYDGLHRSYGEVYSPRSIEELRVLFQRASETRRRVSFRAGEQSFDGQALNEDIVISMSRFDSLEFDPERGLLTVGAGKRWGDIVAALAPHGFVPFTVVSTSYATAGGTVSGDCLSRFSGAAGKEGRYIESLELLTPQGELLRLTHDGETSELFHAVIGGLGYLGAVVRVTYRVARVGLAGEPIRVVTRAARHESLEDLAESLLPDSPPPAPGGGADEPAPEALYSIAFRTLDGTRSTVLRSRYASGTSLALRPMLTHRPRHPLRVLIEWMIRFTVVSKGIWTLVDRFFFDFTRPYVDDLFGYTFFMDGNVLSKQVGQLFGMPMTTVQQAFLIPFDPSAREEGLRRLVDFLREIDEVTTEAEIPPTLLDVLSIKGDDFLLSANYGTDGFAVTLAFETSDEESVQRIRIRLAALSERAAELGGRVYLVKNVHVAPATLEAMYRHALPDFVRLKRLVDPEGLLRNEFLERLFPTYFAPPPRRAIDRG